MVMDRVRHQDHAETHDDTAVRPIARGLVVDDYADAEGADHT